MQITIITDEKTYIVPFEERISLEEAIRGQGIPCPFYCNGLLKCGKCRVKFLENPPIANRKERSVLSEKEIDAGYRLACKCEVNSDCKIYVPSVSNMAALSGFDGAADDVFVDIADYKADIGIAIDLGTTTIACSVFRVSDNKNLFSATYENHQRNYGADVISRLQFNMHDTEDKLRRIIRRDLDEVITDAVNSSDVVSVMGDDIGIGDVPIVLSGNTAMIHFLMGFDTSKLGVSPYAPFDTDMQTVNLDCGANIRTFPMITSFVGADIVAGIYALDMDISEGVNILLDFGTNGEMVIGNRDFMYVSSVAAGPAFEGGNISCGMPSLSGAIYSVDIKNGFNRVKTIDNKTAVGLCGTGVLEAVYEMSREGIIDVNGTLLDTYGTEYNICQLNQKQVISINQDDIRQVQMAKSAFRAGIECLMNCAAMRYEDIDNIYIAGGFGYYLDISKIIGIGMLPEAWKSKIKVVGNASLEGCRKYIRHRELDRIANIIKKSEEVILADDEHFSDLYLEYMSFNN